MSTSNNVGVNKIITENDWTTMLHTKCSLQVKTCTVTQTFFFYINDSNFFLLNPSAIQGQEHSLTGQKVKIKKESQKVLNSACHPNLSHYHNLSKI